MSDPPSVFQQVAEELPLSPKTPFERVCEMMGTEPIDVDNVVFVVHFPQRVVWIQFAADVPYECDIPVEKMLALIESKKPEWHHETIHVRKGRMGWPLSFSFAAEEEPK
jgi:hypothetical protein